MVIVKIICRSPWPLGLAGVVGSYPTEGIDVCLLWGLCVVEYWSLRRAVWLGYGCDDRWIWFNFWHGKEILFYSETFMPPLVPTQPHIQRVPERSFPVVKWPGREAYHALIHYRGSQWVKVYRHYPDTTMTAQGNNFYAVNFVLSVCILY